MQIYVLSRRQRVLFHQYPLQYILFFKLDDCYRLMQSRQNKNNIQAGPFKIYFIAHIFVNYGKAF